MEGLEGLEDPRQDSVARNCRAFGDVTTDPQRAKLFTMNHMSGHQNEPAGSEKSSSGGELEREIALLITQALNLDIPAADIDPEAPLYRDGLGLDSIDILEVSLVVSKRYGVEIKANSEDNQNTFRSLRGLAQFVAEHRTR